jgi:subtilase family serine protease/Tol biopolymer transport system component/flagellar hook assembly protein FlgD/fibronectin type 3 domain-containing protein
MPTARAVEDAMSLPSKPASSRTRLRDASESAAVCGRLVPVLLGAILLLGTGSLLPAQTREELRAAARRLRQVEGSLEPLPDSGITRDVGQIAVVEHDGSVYDARLPDDTLNYEARTRVGHRFYETHADEYDFLVVFTNFEFETNDATAFHLFGRNDVEGIGKPVNSLPDVFGSRARLKGWIDMAAVSRYRQRPFSVAPGDMGFLQTLNVLAHEVGHQWLAEARYKAGGVSHDDLLGQDGNHWSYLLDSDASLHYGADWRDNGDGTFTAARVKEHYSALDLYLMGFLPKEKVAPFLLLQNPAIDRRRINREGEVVAATGTTEIAIDQLVEEMGPRKPSSLHSQKEFRLGFVFLTQPGTEPSPEDMEAVERVRSAFGAHFFALTNGVAWADTTLVETPGPPRAAAPDLEKALAWLAARQGLDGSWSDSAETRPRDTGAAVWALATAGATGPAWQRGIAWLQQARPESLDFRARLARALAPGSLTTPDRAARIASLLSSQNADGGFGAGADFSSDALDTALALRALRALEHPEDAGVRRAVDALRVLANPDGGWPGVAGGETSTVVTAEVLLALLDWSDAPGSAALRGPGLAVLLARQNDDGGFGSSPSTPHASALALEVLLRAGAPVARTDHATAWLEANQLADGSWAGSPYQTALVLAALRQSLGANLVVPAGTLVVAPNPAQEGESVHVAARVRNAGREAAPATVARLYDGDPASSPSRGEAPVPALAPGEEAEVAFDYPTQDRAGVRTLYVVADAAAQVRESREDDNTASRALTVVGKLADLEILPTDILVSPVVPETGESTTIGVKVSNRGERASVPSVLSVSVADPYGLRLSLPDQTLPVLEPGQTATLAFGWTPAVAGSHVVMATADARFDVPESDETNNGAGRPLQVAFTVPDGTALALLGAEVTPASLEELPQALSARVVVENAGRTGASTTVAVYDPGSGYALVGSAPVEVGPRSSVTLTVPFSITTPGERTLRLVVDPENAIPEENEYDNATTVRLGDARTSDLEVAAATLSSPEVQVGQPVTVTAEIRNRGTVNALAIPVQLGRQTPDGVAELARTALDVPAGTAGTVSMSWRPAVPEDDVPLVVRVDPFDLLKERNEGNNAASLSLRVRPSDLPNLTVSGADIKFTPDPPVEGQSASISVVVHNTGGVPAGPFVVRFFVGDPEKQGTPIGDAAVAGLDPGTSATASIDWSAVNVRGSLGLFAVADALSQITEANEDDNRAFRPFQAIGFPDLVLVPADVAFDPGYPRVGDAVTIRATVRNLGEQTSQATTVVVTEGDTGIGVLPLPALGPGGAETVSVVWTPASPPGERTVSFLVDPDGLVVEQDEGNNTVRRPVVVQDADVYLTETYFSPNGDGVKDTTTLAWRGAERLKVVVSNRLGQAVRTLVGDGAESSAATWDGRDEHGVVALDGHYTLTLTAEDGRRVRTTGVVLDTNRSPIHDVTRPAGLAIRNLTCALPESWELPVWLPGEDGLLAINRQPTAGFPVGLLRLDLDGGYSYVAVDDWYASTYFVSDRIVSPDGQEVLVVAGSQVVAVNLTTGNRRPIGDPDPGAYYWSGVRWSPDGRWILAGGKVYARDGSEVADLGGMAFGYSQAWDWSPDSTRLALGDLIVSRDGTVLHASVLANQEYATINQTQWRGDGRIVTRLSTCRPEDRMPRQGEGGPPKEACERSLLIDPDTGAAADLGWDPGWSPAWSPDGTRAIVGGRLYDAVGTVLGRPLPNSATVSPYSGAALALIWRSNSADPLSGLVCGDKARDTFVISNLANLTADVRPARLPANEGLLLYGTVGDRNLDHYQLDYARRDEAGTWHPIGPALDAPTVDDQLAVWAPREPGTYFIRLSAVDRAGNRAVRTRALAWDRVPALASFSQSGFFLSPGGNGVKEVRLDFFVVEPTRVEIRVTGPEPASPSAPPARQVRTVAREYGSTGPQSFVWDGRDDSNAVVPDGRYTIFLNGLPFRVQVDSTPPEIGYRLDDLHVVAPVSLDGPVCTFFRKDGDPGSVELGMIQGWEQRYAVDPNLRSWRLTTDSFVIDASTEPVYKPVIGPDGLPILDDGVPRVQRDGGQPAGERRESAIQFAQEPGLRFEAEDLAGNRSTVGVPLVPEGLFAMGAAARCAPILKPPVRAEQEDPKAPPVNALAPRDVVLLAGGNLNAPSAEQGVRFSFEPREGGPRQELPMTPYGGDWYLPIADFGALGDPTATYRGRFVGDGAAGEVAGDDFLFRPCPEWLIVKTVVTGTGAFALLSTQTKEPLARVWLTVRYPIGPPLTIDMQPAGDGVYVSGLPPPSCPPSFTYSVGAETISGRFLPESDTPDQCHKTTDGLSLPCAVGLAVKQVFEGCAGSPDRLSLLVSGTRVAGSRVEVERGPADAPVPVGSFIVPPSLDNPTFSETLTADVSGEPEGGMPVRARMVPPNPKPDDVPVTAEIVAVIDRTPPTGEVLLPPEGGLLCASPATGDELSFQALANDNRSPEIEVHARARPVGGAWSVLTRICKEGDATCRADPSKITPRRPVGLNWSASAFPADNYKSETTFCDQSGNATRVPRSFSLVRQPRPWIVSVSRRLFSPNGDGRADQTLITVRLAQAGVLTTRVHAGTQEGAVVRTLGDQFQTASDVAIAWDGRGDGAQTVPDGPYVVVFTVTDPCGGTGEVATSVEVDTVPPEVAITDPVAGQRVSASVDVTGQATDAHFGTWQLDAACGAEPWSMLESHAFPVPAGGFIARWDVSRAPPGECRLRLAAEDAAGNRSREAEVAVQVERGDLILRLAASPDIFSPNGDGRRETATLDYELQRSARVRLQVRDQAGRPLRTFEDAVVRAAGAWSFTWDGRNDASQPAAEGDHVVWIRAEDPQAPSVYEEKTTRLVLDRTPPNTVISRPTADSFLSVRTNVRGSITDLHLAGYTITVTPAGGAPIEIARASQERKDSELTPLSELPEGPTVLRVVAADLAENEARLEVPFVVDSIPPVARIQSPADAAFLRRGETPIPVTGLVADDHLASWTLRFAAGAEPASFVPIAQGEIGGNGIPLGSWDVRFIPDGVYTLSLVATDRAGLSTEARIAVTLDARPPTVALSRPVAGGYVTKPGPVVGTASDANLASWELESAPGEAVAAYQWSPLVSGKTSVTDETLADWSPLPPDGVYTLRLSARDKVDLTASTRTTVTVDTTPPATPTGLKAKVTKAREGYGQVVVTWNPNTEPDLAGYRIERPKEEWSTEILGSPAWDDGERIEGRYTYRVLAEDKAGNQSPPATLVVLVDLTPPLVSFSFPAADASVAGAVDVRGTAWSADDFAEYRLLVGAGDAPALWTLLRRSSVPVAGGTLGEWLALEDGPHVLALEAADTNGNEARVTRRVVVDTLPPAPPVLVEVARPGTPADRLVPRWDPSPSADVAGYLVYRNGRLANAVGVVLGDLHGYLVPGPNHVDDGLPDGKHCYHVVAMDGAGNESVPSNEICQSLDNRPPAAVVVQPPERTRFGHPVQVVAYTPDLDVMRVRFELSPAGAGQWREFAVREWTPDRPIPPWEAMLDPDVLHLVPGDYDLRAVATDLASQTDPAPAAIKVTYGDTTPPPAPTGLVAQVDGADVSLAWTPVDVPDLASYRLYRDGQRIAQGLTEPQHVDPGRAPETYEYAVTAVDADGNESAPSAPAEAIVYAVSLEQPVWPIVSTPFASVKGDGSRPQTTVTVLRDGAGIAEGAATGGAFRIDGVPLVPDGNVLQARGEDAAGNRSISSNEIVLISNTPPAAVTGLEAQVDGTSVSLRWSPVADADVVGYVVRRDGNRLTGTVPQSEIATIGATSDYWGASSAFDGNPATSWMPEAPGTGTWTVVFPAPVLVEQVRLRFAQPEGSNPGIPASYTLLARFEDRDLPVVRVRGNTKLTAEHRLPAPFLTYVLSVALDSPGGLAEVAVDRLDVVPAGSETFLDGGVPEARHAYAVAAIDRYGAEGAAGTVEAAVGDVNPPSRPTGLVATPIVRDVHLTWNKNPEPDVTHYVVLRDASRIGTSPSPSYVDPGRPNGTWRYAVIAVDAAGQESGESDPADATIDLQPVPPAAPVILEPTDAAHPITLDASRTDVAGRADAGSFVALEVDGQPRGAAPAAPGFLGRTSAVLGAYGQVALSPDAHLAAWGEYGGSVSIQDVGGGEVRSYPVGGDGIPQCFVFSPDGTTLAFTRLTYLGPAAGYRPDVVLLDLADGTARTLVVVYATDLAWSPDGSRLALSVSEVSGSSLHVLDRATGALTELGRSSGLDTHLRWSPDGKQLAYIRSWSWGAAAELQVLDLGSSHTRVLDPQPWPSAPPSWSPDGRRLAWTTASAQPLRVRVQEIEGEQEPVDVVEPGSDAVDARFSPDGNWLSYIRLAHLPEGTTLRSVHAIHQRQDLRVTVSEPREGYGAPHTHDWLGGRLAIRVYDQLDLYAPEAGRFVIRDVPLVPGENRLVARATDPATGLESADSETVLVTVPEEAFPDLAVVPEGIVSLPPVPLAARPAQLRVRVENRGAASAGETEVRVRVATPGGTAVLDTRATLTGLASGGEASLLVPWTPAVAATYTVQVDVDPDGRVEESSEANNSAERAVTVVAEEGLAAEIGSDRASYPSLATAHVTVRVANAGTPFTGVARTTVEDAGGNEVALLDERAVSLEWGRSASFVLDWATGTTPAGRYAFRVRVRATGEADPAATAERSFDIEPGLAVLARVLPQPLTVAEGSPAGFVLSVENRSTNATLDGATARLRVQPEATSGPANFETVRTLASLPPGGAWGATDVWPAAQPAGRYSVRFEVTKGDVVLAAASAVLTIEAAAPSIRGTLAVEPGHVLAGQSAEAHVTLENRGTAGVSGYPLVVEVVSGPEATVHLSVPATVDLSVGESRSLTLSLPSGGIAPGPYVVRLRGGANPETLDRSRLVVHGAVVPPSPHAPADGARVETPHPLLVVNDASSPEGAALTYEFEIFGDGGLTQALPGTRGLAETPSRTSWRVAAALAEDTTYWWRARATDGFSTSAWCAVSAFTVDAVNRPPTAPIPDTPAPGARVASRQPALTVRNAIDPEGQPLTYEFRLAVDADMTQVVAAQAGVKEGLGFTSWTVTTTLEEDAAYHWSARARTAGDTPEDFSPWSVPVSFRVDTVNGPPTAPQPLRPIGGREVATHAPELVVGNATDPEGDPLTYRFEIDARPDLGSPDRQVSAELPPGAGETAWTPPLELRENTPYYWRAHASDGNTATPSAVVSFFVNAANEAPGAPVPLDPVDGRAVGTATPTLRLRNAVDPEGDPLTYEFEVRDAHDAVVASAAGIPSGPEETVWVVTPSLAEDQAFTWWARASDGALVGPWSARAAFRVNAVAEPPTAPIPRLPADRAVLEERRPSLVVENATSPDGLSLTYTFELEAVAADGSGTPVDRVEGVAEGPQTTAWTPSTDLADGSYQWLARASDPQQHGPWSATWRFAVLVDRPPAAPTGLRAVAGDARVRLDWDASSETDLTGYRVYRSTTAGGPHAFIAAVPTNSHDDLGLTNGVTYYYVVTATDARAESGPSNEAAARPEAPHALVAEVRFDPSSIRAECLLPAGSDHYTTVLAAHPASGRAPARPEPVDDGRGGGFDESCHPSGCPDWLLATLELPVGHDPATIEVASLRLFGSLSADPGYGEIVDVDHDGLAELRVRFRFEAVAPHLSIGPNSGTIVGRAGGSELQGTGTIQVLSLSADLRVTPRTLEQRSKGEDVLARLTFAEGVAASKVLLSSVRLNGVVPVERVVNERGQELLLKFDRAAVIGVLPLGESVEVRVTGTLEGVPFAGVDHIRVIE